MTLLASDTTDVLDIAGALAIGGTAGVGAGVDVIVLSKTTKAIVGADSAITVLGNVTVDALSREEITSISAGAGFSGTAAVTVNAGVSVIDVTTVALLADGPRRATASTSRRTGASGYPRTRNSPSTSSRATSPAAALLLSAPRSPSRW